MRHPCEAAAHRRPAARPRLARFGRAYSQRPVQHVRSRGTARTPPSTRPVGAAATCGLPRCLPASSFAHPGPAAGSSGRITSLTPYHFVDPHRHAVRTAQLVLPRVHLRPLRGGDVPVLTNIQAFPVAWNRPNEHRQVGVRPIAPTKAVLPEPFVPPT